jgi:hypothetical protein
MWSIPTFQEFLNELNRADSDAELNEAVSSANVKAYYSAVCKAEKIKELPLKFQNVKYGGASTSYNDKTGQPLYISFDLSKLKDPERAILHEITHQIKLQTEGNPYLGKADQQPKFKKLENYLIDKYTYSELSNLLWANK